MNVFISIIEEAYVSSKTRDRNHWIYSYLKVDPQYVEIHPEGNKPIEKVQQMNKKIMNEDDGNHSEEEEKEKHEEELYEKDYSKIKKKIRSQNSLRDLLSLGKKDIKKDTSNNNTTIGLRKSKTVNPSLPALDKVSSRESIDAFNNNNNIKEDEKEREDEENLEEIEKVQLKEVSDYLNSKFEKIDKLMDDIALIANEVKQSNKKAFVKEFQVIVNDNLAILNVKFRELTNFWAYDVSD